MSFSEGCQRRIRDVVLVGCTGGSVSSSRKGSGELVKGLGMTDQVDSLGGVGYSTHREWFVEGEDQRNWFGNEGKARGKTLPVTGRRHQKTKICKTQEFNQKIGFFKKGWG